jgi:hypothetical protein
MKCRWELAPPQPLLAGRLASDLNLSPLLAQCLLNRGLSEPGSIGPFLDPRLKQLADPFLLPNMNVAVERLFRAHAGNEALVIFGDYDVDGVTSTALLTETFRALGWKVNHYLPHRMEEGYGLSLEGVENCLKKFPVTLLLAVDCGSTAVEAVAWLRGKGVDVLVLDHHQVSSPAPEAVAIVNPRIVFGGPGVQTRARAGQARPRTRFAGRGGLRHPPAARFRRPRHHCRSRAAHGRKPDFGFDGIGTPACHDAAGLGGVETCGRGRQPFGHL